MPACITTLTLIRAAFNPDSQAERAAPPLSCPLPPFALSRHETTAALGQWWVGL